MRGRSLVVVGATLALGLAISCGGKLTDDSRDGGTGGGTDTGTGIGTDTGTGIDTRPDTTGTSTSTCPPPPSTTTVSCTPAATGFGCKGLPVDPWGPAGASPSATDSVFPLGCTVVFPHVNPYYPCSGGQDCTCEADVEGYPPGWSCPL